jgi:hypothetical protein
MTWVIVCFLFSLFSSPTEHAQKQEAGKEKDVEIQQLNANVQEPNVNMGGPKCSLSEC